MVDGISNSKMQDLIKTCIDNNYDVSKIRPNHIFTFNADLIYDVFKMEPYKFKYMVQRALIHSISDYWSLLGSKARTPNDQLTDGARIMRENVSGRSHPFQKVFKNIKVNITMSANTKLCNIDSKNEKIPLCFECKVIGMYEKKTYVKVGKWFCQECNHTINVESDPITRKQPKKVKCDIHKMSMELVESMIITGDVQTLIIQERMEDSDNMIIEKKFAKIFDESVGTIKAGDNLKVIGVFRSMLKDNHHENDVIIDIIDTENMEDIKPVMPSSEELKKWKNDAINEDEFFNRVVDSFAINVKGHRKEKMALLMTLAGGTPIVKKNGQKKRGSIHTYLVGDRSTAKSLLLKAVKAVAHKSMITGGKGVSAVGLTAGVIKQADGSSMLELGVFPLCDNGTAVIDEFDKMNRDDRGVLHICMEDQFVPIDKGGFHATPQCRTTTIAASNPKGGKWGKNGKDIMDNIDLDEALLTRFDNIFLFLDKVDDVKDTEIGMHMLNSWTNTESEFDTVYMETHQIKTYLNYVRSKYRPELSEKAKVKLLEFFKKIRNLSNTQDTLPVAFRQLDGIARMSMARAKMLFRDIVQESDVQLAIDLYKFMLETFGVDVDSGKIQEVFGSPKEMKKAEAFWHVFESCQDSEGNIKESQFLEELVSNKNSSRYFDEDSAAKEWNTKRNDLEILHNSNGTYRRS